MRTSSGIRSGRGVWVLLGGRSGWASCRSLLEPSRRTAAAWVQVERRGDEHTRDLTAGPHLLPRDDLPSRCIVHGSLRGEPTARVLETAVAQLRFALSLALGRPFHTPSLEHLIDAIRETQQEFGPTAIRAEGAGAMVSRSGWLPRRARSATP